jgi:hypothetical protein
MQCPVCSKDVKTDAGLRKHAMGGRGAGGHEHTVDEAELLLQRARGVAGVVRVARREVVVTPAPPEAALAFLTEAFDVLVANKRLPKYQFERRVDIFVNVFLPDVLTALFGGTYQLVVPEFPLKKDDNHQCTNVDYLLFHTTRDGHERWVFLELKTAAGSIGEEQLAIYRRSVDRGMPALMRDLPLIRERTKARAEYDELALRLSALPHDRPIEIIYLAPVAMNGAELGPGGRCVTFEQLQSVEIARHPEVWRMFRDSVLARAF